MRCEMFLENSGSLSLSSKVPFGGHESCNSGADRVDPETTEGHMMLAATVAKSSHIETLWLWRPRPDPEMMGPESRRS